MLDLFLSVSYFYVTLNGILKHSSLSMTLNCALSLLSSHLFIAFVYVFINARKSSSIPNVFRAFPMMGVEFQALESTV